METCIDVNQQIMTARPEDKKGEKETKRAGKI
jgi:hypothetical protein